MGCIVYTDYVYPAIVTLLAAISCLLFLFRKFVCLFYSTISFSFFLSVACWPFHTRLIRAAILHFSFRLHPDDVVLICDLLFQSAAFVFLDGGRVSEGLVRVKVS